MVSATEVVDAINAAWRAGRVEELAAHFDPAMVILSPKENRRVQHHGVEDTTS
jgi:hypothetical protein